MSHWIKSSDFFYEGGTSLVHVLRYVFIYSFLFFHYDDWVMEISIYSLKGCHHLAHSDLCASSSLLPESKSYIRIPPPPQA